MCHKALLVCVFLYGNLLHVLLNMERILCFMNTYLYISLVEIVAQLLAIHPCLSFGIGFRIPYADGPWFEYPNCALCARCCTEKEIFEFFLYFISLEVTGGVQNEKRFVFRVGFFFFGKHFTLCVHLISCLWLGGPRSKGVKCGWRIVSKAI